MTNSYTPWKSRTWGKEIEKGEIRDRHVEWEKRKRERQGKKDRNSERDRETEKERNRRVRKFKKRWKFLLEKDSRKHYSLSKDIKYQQKKDFLRTYVVIKIAFYTNVYIIKIYIKIYIYIKINKNVYIITREKNELVQNKYCLLTQ